jgi:hypothetical protein
MYKFRVFKYEESFELFDRAATKGHEDSIWIASVVKEAEFELAGMSEALLYSIESAFAKTETPMGWYMAGELFWKKSAEGGCVWGIVGRGLYLKRRLDEVAVPDEKAYLECLEGAANQNNPQAMQMLGEWFRGKGGDKETAVAYHQAAAELGWMPSMVQLWAMAKSEGRLSEAVRWGAQARVIMAPFWMMLRNAEKGNKKFQRPEVYYALGWGLYWHRYGGQKWNERNDRIKAFGNQYLDYYCSCVELQQKSIFTFLLCWNRVTGVKDVGVVIAKMVWEGRENNLVKPFGVAEN